MCPTSLKLLLSDFRFLANSSPAVLVHLTSRQRWPRCPITELPPPLVRVLEAGSTSLTLLPPFSTSLSPFTNPSCPTPSTDWLCFLLLQRVKWPTFPHSFPGHGCIPRTLWLLDWNPWESPGGGKRATFAGKRGACSHIWHALLLPLNGFPQLLALTSSHPEVVHVAALFLQSFMFIYFSTLGGQQKSIFDIPMADLFGRFVQQPLSGVSDPILSLFQSCLIRGRQSRSWRGCSASRRQGTATHSHWVTLSDWQGWLFSLLCRMHLAFTCGDLPCCHCI